MVDHDILSAILDWAKREDSIRALVLVGSRAQNETVDDLADFDIQVFTTTCDGYLSDSQWINAIEDVWVCVHDRYEDLGNIISTRLVIYEGGVKVDFAFYNVPLLPRMTWSGPYKVLLDKDDLVPANNIVEKHSELPTQQEFTRIVNEFWFEVYHVAKYLKRKELWLAKSRDWSAKAFLLQMIQWNEWIRQHGVSTIREDGRNFGSVANPSTQNRLPGTFSDFGPANSWAALVSMTDLFRDLAVETSEKLNVSYSKQLDEKITNFVVSLSKS